MTRTRRTFVRNEQGQIILAVSEDGTTEEILRDADGVVVGMEVDRPPEEPKATAAELRQVSERVADTHRVAAEIALVAGAGVTELSERVNKLEELPPPATQEEFRERLARARAQLGSVRDGGPLHVAVLGAVTAAQQGDLERAVGLLRGIE